jgi:tRNA threonylcarbamoyladenosine biosynthesis protein TsaE
MQALMQKFLKDSEATEQFGAELYQTLPSKCLVFLHGDLGVGKTTLVRGYLRAAGYAGTVKSPTYNLVEEYAVAGQKVYHFDLYRLNGPEELEWIGIKDYFNQACVCFVEWPDQGNGYLPKPDWVITLSVQGDGRLVSMAQNQGM